MTIAMDQPQAPRRRRKPAPRVQPPPPPAPPPPIHIHHRAPRQSIGGILGLLNEFVKPFIGERPEPYDPTLDRHELYRDARERQDLPLHVDQDKEARHGTNETVHAIRLQLWEMHRTLFITLVVIIFVAAKSGINFGDLLSFLAV